MPLSAGVHIVGEGCGRSVLVWEAAGQQLLAVAGGGRPRQRWRRATRQGGCFPLALATNGLVLCALSLCAAPSTGAHANRLGRLAALARPEPEPGEPEPEPEPEPGPEPDGYSPRSAVARYDVRLQAAVLQGFDLCAFDPVSLPPTSTITTACTPRCVERRKIGSGLPQPLKRPCGVCVHAIRARSAQQLLAAFDGWIAGVQQSHDGRLAAAAATFRQAALAAEAVQDDALRTEAAVLWSNAAECLLRRGAAHLSARAAPGLALLLGH
eukprot:COSAG04_NODE_5533_length_1580_cov_1.754220_1_plen_267_part_01